MGHAIALTGGPGCGKSTVLKIFGELGLKTESADRIAGELFGDSSFQREVAEALGMDYPIDRVEMRRRTFEDTEFRRAVNKLFHHRVWSGILRSDADIVEVPLLFESGLAGEFGTIVAVVCSPEDQFGRLVDRWGEERLVEAVLGSQLAQTAKAALSDDIVRTSCPLDAVHSRAEKLLPDLLRRVSLDR